jgi:glycosyltransferase involved in cell wall biosynthesis
VAQSSSALAKENILKVLCLYNIPSPYRVEFCNALAKDVSLDVVFERKVASDRNTAWFNSTKKKFNAYFLNGMRFGNEQALSFGIFRFLKINKYDLIIIGGYSTPTSMLAILYMKIIKMRYVLNADGAFIKPDTNIKRKIKTFFIKNAFAWLSTGKNTSDYFKHYGADKSNIFEYPFSSISKSNMPIKVCAIDEKKSIRKELNISEDKVVVTVGQFIKRKGFDILLASWQNMKENCGLYIIGDTPTDEYLKLVEDLNLKNVHFLPFMSKEKLTQHYRASDLFVLPTREDIWGLVIGEAMAQGLAIITTDQCNAGLALVDQTCGFITPTEDTGALNHALIKILTDDELAKSMGKNSFEKISEYTIENMATKHVEIFKKILSR